MDMTIRGFVGLLLFLIFLATLGIIVVSGIFQQGQLAPLFANLETNRALTAVFIQTSVASLLLSMALLTFLFFAVGRYVATPIRRITRAMTAFAETGAAPAEMSSGWVPNEVRTLKEAFLKLAGGVAEVHKHDVEISRVKSDFISTAAHQLRTPLTGVRWALEALQMEQLTESQKALVASAVEKSHQLVAVVGTLLDISSIESGKYKYDFKEMSLDPIVDAVTRDFQALAAKTNVALFFEKSGNASAVVRIDQERIRWVLNNLIENAIRYTPAGGQVRVTTLLAPGRAYVKVRDTGIGIAPADRGNIFERFYRAPNAIAKENGGNGLGLYIARTVATDHGGDLNFESNQGGSGTTFTLSLPLAG
jgi:signal transduction histidine kinase